MHAIGFEESMRDRAHMEHVLNLAADVTARAGAVDVTRLSRVLRVDPAMRTCVAESGVTFGRLARTLFHFGLSACIARVRETMTLGGAVVYMPSVFHESCIEYEVVTRFGDVVRLSRTRDRRRFNAMRASRGELGVITELTFRLVTAPSSRICRTNESSRR